MPWNKRQDTDLEVIAAEVAAPEGYPRRLGRDPRHVAVVGAVVIALIAVLAIAVVRRRHHSGSVIADPTAAEINRRAAVALSRFVTVTGDKMLSRPVAGIGEDSLLGVIRLAAGEPGAAASPSLRAAMILSSGTYVSALFVLAEGTDLSGVGQTGTWLYFAFANIPPVAPVFLGPSTSFVPSVDSRDAWLADASTVREVGALLGGSTIMGPYPIDGRLVGAAGAGLVLQRGNHVVWWLPGAPGRSVLIGSGRAFDASGDFILWQTASGLVTITDPNSGRTVATAFSLPRSQQVRAAAMTSDLSRVAAATDTTLVISDTLKHRRVDVHLPAIDALTWLDDNNILVREGARGVIVVDAATGAVAREADLPSDAQGLAIIVATGP